MQLKMYDFSSASTKRMSTPQYSVLFFFVFGIKRVKEVHPAGFQHNGEVSVALSASRNSALNHGFNLCTVISLACLQWPFHYFIRETIRGNSVFACEEVSQL